MDKHIDKMNSFSDPIPSVLLLWKPKDKKEQAPFSELMTIFAFTCEHPAELT